jgi:dipeptidyl aminopeptidase/acylaminoacyl peptidase
MRMNIKNRACAFASLTILAILLAAVSVAAPAFTLEEIRNFAFPDTLVVSPRGSRVAWLMSDRGIRNVWVAEAPGFAPRQLTAYTQDDGQEISSIAISADGNSVVYVLGGDHGANWDGGLSANPTSNPAGTTVQVWYAPFAGGAPTLVSDGDWPVISPDNRRLVFIKDKAAWVASLGAQPEPKRLFTIRGATVSPAWSPDGSKLAFVSDRDSHSLIGIYSDERSPVQWMAPSFTQDSAPRWSPDGKFIAFVREPGAGGAPEPMLEFKPSPWAIWIGEVASGDAKELWRSGSALRDGYFEGLFEWAAGDRIVFQSFQDGWQHLYAMSRSGGAPVLLTPGNYMVEDASLSADKRSIVFSANHGKAPGDADRRHVFQVGVDGEAPKQLTSGVGLEWSPVLSDDGQVVFISSTAQRPPVVTVQSTRDDRMRMVGASGIPATHPSAQLVTPKPVTFQADDGFTVRGQLFEPKARGKHAAVVYVHGGPRRQMLLGWHPMEYYSNDYAVNQYLVSRGYVVLSVNYRLGTGYGHEFQFPPASGMRGGSEYKDIQAAGRMLQSLANVDPDRIGIYGGSYGGYLTAMALAHDSSLFKVGVDIHGVHNWAARYDFGAVTARAPLDMPTDATQALETAWQSSPVAALSGWKSPVLFIHGDDDRNVRVSQTVDLVRRLQLLDVTLEMMNLPDETHSILRYANVLKMNAATAEFLERHLREQRR